MLFIYLFFRLLGSTKYGCVIMILEDRIMDIRILKYFLAVAQEESISKAAEFLHTTQPNLSRQLNQLEEEIGKKLFERGSRKITLTEEGMFLRKRAKEIVDLTERTELELSTFNETTSGDVYIGAAETDTMRLIAQVILQQQEKYPQIKYHIFSGSTAEITELLNKGLLDFGILVEPVNLEKYDYLKLPKNDQWGVLMPKDHHLAQRNSIRPEDVQNERVIMAQQQLEGNLLSGWLGEYGKSINIVGTFNLITTPAMMVEAGLGIVFTFDKLVNTTGDSKLCFRPLEPRFETSLFLAWKKYQIFSKPAKLFLEQVQSSLF